MARYYFNLVLPDQQGVEIPEVDLEQVLAGIIEEIRAEDPELSDLGVDWSIEVVDEQGRRVAIFPL
jgi:hypothetical protein